MGIGLAVVGYNVKRLLERTVGKCVDGYLPGIRVVVLGAVGSGCNTPAIHSPKLLDCCTYEAWRAVLVVGFEVLQLWGRLRVNGVLKQGNLKNCVDGVSMNVAAEWVLLIVVWLLDLEASLQHL